MGKISGSAGGTNATETWLPSRGIFYKDERLDRNKIVMVEFVATSDEKRRMPLGFWLLVGVLHEVSSFSFVESVSFLCCARGGQSVIDVVEVLAVVCFNLCCVLGGGSRSRLCNQSASVVCSGEAVAVVCAVSQPMSCARGKQSQSAVFVGEGSRHGWFEARGEGGRGSDLMSGRFGASSG